nr:MAG TPA: hypothetical protein [Caudoviricetes sp.]DAT44661.1 MAG TPA: hypothetical protein [Caudoviricetes sp.]
MVTRLQNKNVTHSLNTRLHFWPVTWLQKYFDNL